MRSGAEAPGGWQLPSRSSLNARGQQRIDGLMPERLGDEEALAGLASHGIERRQLLGSLDALRDAHQPQAAGQADHRSKDGAIGGAAADSPDEGPVEFDDVDGKVT